MKRRDKAVRVSAALAVAVIATVAVSLLVRDRRSPPTANRAESSSSLLVVTWGPSLCAVEPSNSGCRSGHVGQLGQTFVLHGLWPQPSSEQYCDVPERVSDRKRTPVPLPDDLRNRLQTMLSDPAFMTTHEWYAHGTCSGVTPPEYFGVATDLAREAIRILNPVFAGSAGRKVSARSVRQTFDTAFGAGAGMRIGLSCKKANGADVVYEVKLSLPPVVVLRQDVPSLAAALATGPTVPPGCGQGRVP
ncbi:MAG: ribonuclease T(2) [Mycobacteriaceae bacterium]